MRRDPFGRPAGKHSLGVSAHRYRVPFALIVFESAHQELAMGDGQLDGAEHRFERLVAQGIEFCPSGSSIYFIHDKRAPTDPVDG